MSTANPNPQSKPQTPQTPRRRAVAYLRMSTDLQQYSTENQKAAIEKYAAENEMEIVATYSDEARSGLRYENRPGMQQMLADAQSADAGFDTILVYDISRWGRFQDQDEGAALEFACRKARVQVHYCMEQFVNDGSPMSTVMKSLGRYAAADYSSKLSAKVFAGQCRLIERGYRQGGMAGYGLRRMRIDQKGEPQGVLDWGQRKSLQTDRVILVPGPEEEVETVRWMYREFIDGGRLEGEIAAALNEKGVVTDLGRPWTRGTVHQVLTNEKYIGNNVFNRHSYKLKKTHKDNPPEEWVRADGAFEAIVDPQLFFTAQGMIRERNRRFSNDELLDRLKRLFKQKGFLSGIVIDDAENMPSSACYAARFGSLVRAYTLVGFTPERDYEYIEINRTLRRSHAAVVAETIEEIERIGGAVSRDPATDLLTVNGEFTASIVLSRCRPTKAGSKRWKIRLDTGLAPDLTVALRMDAANEAVLDYYLLPLPMLDTNRIRLAEENGLVLDAFRFETLDHFFAMAERALISELAS
ncbi:MAG: recombinase family protein [Rhodospirillaceae bacterium]|nr:recombinase family protein [Rhodospirillaceae bacterium]